MHCLALATTTLHTWESDFISANPYQLTPTVPVLCIYIYIFHYICDLIYLYILYSKLIYIYIHVYHTFSHQFTTVTHPTKKIPTFPFKTKAQPHLSHLRSVAFRAKVATWSLGVVQLPSRMAPAGTLGINQQLETPKQWRWLKWMEDDVPCQLGDGFLFKLLIFLRCSVMIWDGGGYPP